jgi:hypothetical protein
MPNRLRHIPALAAFLFCTAAQAQSFRAYLSSTGSDSNPCTVSAPCRLLPAALAAIASGGEVWILDSANYNSASVDVNKSATILASPGVVASVVTLGGPALSISTAGLNVTLRGLVIVPFPGGGGTHGVEMTNGASLTVENCVISGMNMTQQAGVRVAAAARVKVTDTVIRNAYHGIRLSDGATANISTTKISGMMGSAVEVFADTGTTATTAVVNDSVLSDSNVGANLHQGGTATAIGRIVMTNTTSSGNAFGAAVVAIAPANAVVSIGNSTLSANSYGMYNAGGTLKSLGNNFVSDNAVDVSGTVTPVPPR